jgi:hypothetical protein
MSRADDEAASTPAKRIIFRTRERVQEVRNHYHRERVNGGVSEETHRELATVALMYRDVLAEHADEAVVRDKWRESGVDNLEALVGQTRAVDEPAPGRTANTRTVSKPAVLTVPHGEIFMATKKLDTLAKELGFAASAREKTPEDEGTLEDLYHLLGQRGQTEAQERLPFEPEESESEGEEKAIADGGEEE